MILHGRLLILREYRPITLLIVTAQLGVAPQHIGLISGLLISARAVGGAIGVASKDYYTFIKISILT